jgi:hypothetical protein
VHWVNIIGLDAHSRFQQIERNDLPGSQMAYELAFREGGNMKNNFASIWQ